MQAETKKISEVTGRLDEFRRSLGLNKTGFAEKLGIRVHTYSDMLGTKGVRPSAEIMEAAVRLGASAHWLLTGEGPMPQSEEPVPATPIEMSASGFLFFPLYDLAAGAGIEKDVLSEDTFKLLAFREDFVRGELKRNPAHLFLVTVEGDSMLPTLVDGHTLLFDRSQRRVVDGEIFLLRYYEGLLVKRLERQGADLHLVSDNPAFPRKTVKADELDGSVKILGRLIWGARRY